MTLSPNKPVDSAFIASEMIPTDELRNALDRSSEGVDGPEHCERGSAGLKLKPPSDEAEKYQQSETILSRQTSPKVPSRLNVIAGAK